MGNGWSPAASGAATELALGLEAVSMFDQNIFQGELPAHNSWRERASQKLFSASSENRLRELEEDRYPFV